ncbi:short-chain fatty acid transporter [Parendozoicomonas sp. Alg238-R29]|uniref:short-chain fatty acid transporter n=1 Tax=Parendozoicomonas sp. Alg238-R29 TaxID=2993446 RepID=UPI00248F2B0D|nr:short-chain fatty acid transporter [Parendozoicomonas sp. Alg238-R29]
MQRLTIFFDRLMQRYLPDPFVLSLLLTMLAFLLGFTLTDSSVLQIVQYWGDSFWKLIPFTMQMVLILVTGYILALSPPVHRLLQRTANLVNTPGQGIVLVTLFSIAACWINWGFGLVTGSLFARHMARQQPDIDYRLVIASAYSGFLVWHGGLSGSIPLSIATDNHFLSSMMGVIPVSKTLMAPYNLIILLALLVVLPLINWLMMPPVQDRVTIESSKLDNGHADWIHSVPDDKPLTPAQNLEHSRLLPILPVAMGLTYAVIYFQQPGSGLTLDIVNFLFLILGILCHGDAKRFLHAVTESVKGAGGIIIQFPFYAGIMGIVMSSGLGDLISRQFIALSTAETLPLYTFLSAGLVNLFVPSGGGQWAVQAPVLIPAALELNVDTAKIAMAIAWGDAWTNMIQPFWALPALAVAGLKARDIMGFCLVHLLVSGVIIGTVFYLGSVLN